MNLDVDAYIERSEKWPEEMSALRPILLAAGLSESIKWRKPCYTHRGKNIVIVQEFNDVLSLMFFKGALMSDPLGVLVDQGPNTRSAKRIEFTSVDEVDRLADALAEYLEEAIGIEESGSKIGPTSELLLVEELRDHLDRDPELEAAFQLLTPGRQREYNLYIGAAKQSATRAARVERHADRIKAGKGLRDP